MRAEPSPGSWSSFRKRRRKSISCGDSANASQYIIVLSAVGSVAGILLVLFQPLSLISHLFFHLFIIIFPFLFLLPTYESTYVSVILSAAFCPSYSCLCVVFDSYELKMCMKSYGPKKKKKRLCCSLIYIVTHFKWVLSEPKLAKMFSKRYLQCLRT